MYLLAVKYVFVIVSTQFTCHKACFVEIWNNLAFSCYHWWTLNYFIEKNPIPWDIFCTVWSLAYLLDNEFLPGEYFTLTWMNLILLEKGEDI